MGVADEVRAYLPTVAARWALPASLAAAGAWVRFLDHLATSGVWSKPEPISFLLAQALGSVGLVAIGALVISFSLARHCFKQAREIDRLNGRSFYEFGG